jgi:hypothetical protein
MLRCTLLSVSCLLGITSGTLADIHVWEGNPANCTLDHVDNAIQIDVAGRVAHPSLAMDGGAIFLKRELSWLSNA